MTPAEFKAVEKGYQLHLVDEQDQALAKAQIPQPVFGIDTESVRPQEFVENIHKNNSKVRDRIISGNNNDPKPMKAGTLSPSYQKIMEEKAKRKGG